jgi:selenocysteine-specific elongation factor
MPEHEKPILIATAGHIDHGKSSLVRALTGTDPDRLPEEKARGITIVPGYAHLTLDDGRTISFVDVPGHERFLHHMIQGAQGIRFVLLVVAADDGVMPQTLEHLEVARLLGARAGIIAITKTDLVEPDWLELVEEDIRETLQGTFLQGAQAIRFSAQEPEHFEDVRDKIGALLSALAAEDDADEPGATPFLPADRVITFPGRGVVVTGTLAHGSFEVGDPVKIVPGGHAGRIRELQVHGESVPSAQGPTRLAMNLAGVQREAISIGAMVIPSGLAPNHERVWLASFQTARWLREDLSFPLRGLLHVGTTHVEALIQNLSPDRTLRWDQAVPIRLRLDQPLHIPVGSRFVFRVSSAQGRAGSTVGGGTVLMGGVPARRARAKRDDLALQHLLNDNCADFARGVIALRHPKVVDLPELARILARTQDYTLHLIRSAEDLLLCQTSDGPMVLTQALWAEAQDALLAQIAKHHQDRPQDPGAPLAELRGHMASLLPEGVTEALLEQLVQESAARVTGAFAALPDHEAVLDGRLNELAERTTQILSRSGLEPPTLSALSEQLSCSSKEAREVMTFMTRTERVVRITSEYFVTADRHADFLCAVRDHLATNELLSIDDLRGLSGGLSRKYLVPLAEDLDRRHITLRVGSNRKAGAHA